MAFFLLHLMDCIKENAYGSGRINGVGCMALPNSPYQF